MSKHDELCWRGEDGQHWDMNCDCDKIAKVRQNQSSRIIKLLEAQPCDTKAGHPYECNCEGYETAIALIKGEQK